MKHGPPEYDPPDDDVTRQLAAFAEAITEELQGTATVERRPMFCGETTVTPHRPSALAVTWIDFGSELQLYAGSNGGRWELDRTPDDVAFIAQVARAAIAGRIVEVFAPKRSRVLVTLPDGTVEAETGYEGLGGCLPLPWWPRWGRRVTYLPYRE